MAGATLGRDETLRILSETPQEIATTTASVPASILRTARVLGQWTATDVLAHLRCCEEAGAGMIERILKSPGETVPSIDPRALLGESGYRKLQFQESLRAFARHRASLLSRLRSLPPAGWARTAIVIDRGRRREQRVVDYTDCSRATSPGHLGDFRRAARLGAGRSR